MEKQFRIFIDSSEHLLTEIISTLPNILGAILIFVFGWIIAKIVKRVVIKLLLLIRVDVLTEKTGVNKFLKEGNFKFNFVKLIGVLCYWIIMLTVILSTLNALGLNSAEALFHRIILYIPNIIVSIIVFLIGLYVANLLSKSMGSMMKNMGVYTASILQKVIYYTVVFFTFFLALHQLKISEQIVVSAFILLFGAICLALALAFGLGGKEIAADFLKKTKMKKEEDKKGQ